MSRAIVTTLPDIYIDSDDIETIVQASIPDQILIGRSISYNKSQSPFEVRSVLYQKGIGDDPDQLYKKGIFQTISYVSPTLLHNGSDSLVSNKETITPVFNELQFLQDKKSLTVFPAKILCGFYIGQHYNAFEIEIEKDEQGKFILRIGRYEPYKGYIPYPEPQTESSTTVATINGIQQRFKDVSRKPTLSEGSEPAISIISAFRSVFGDNFEIQSKPTIQNPIQSRSVCCGPISAEFIVNSITTGDAFAGIDQYAGSEENNMKLKQEQAAKVLAAKESQKITEDKSRKFFSQMPQRQMTKEQQDLQEAIKRSEEDEKRRKAGEVAKAATTTTFITSLTAEDAYEIADAATSLQQQSREQNLQTQQGKNCASLLNKVLTYFGNEQLEPDHLLQQSFQTTNQAQQNQAKNLVPNCTVSASSSFPTKIQLSFSGDNRKKEAQELREFLTAQGITHLDPLAGKGEKTEQISIDYQSLTQSTFFQRSRNGLKQLHDFCQSLSQNQGSAKEFADQIFDIATNLDYYIAQFQGISMQGIHSTRSRICKEYEKSKGVYGFTKSEDSERDDLTMELKLPQHIRVRIPDSPFWISIDPITGEFVIATDETKMFLGDLTKIYNETILQVLRQDARFTSVLEEGKRGTHESYYVGQRIYFTQNAFKELKAISQKSQQTLTEEDKRQGQDLAFALQLQQEEDNQREAQISSSQERARDQDGPWQSLTDEEDSDFREATELSLAQEANEKQQEQEQEQDPELQQALRLSLEEAQEAQAAEVLKEAQAAQAAEDLKQAQPLNESQSQPQQLPANPSTQPQQPKQLQANPSAQPKIRKLPSPPLKSLFKIAATKTIAEKEYKFYTKSNSKTTTQSQDRFDFSSTKDLTKEPEVSSFKKELYGIFKKSYQEASIDYQDAIRFALIAVKNGGINGAKEKFKEEYQKLQPKISEEELNQKLKQAIKFSALFQLNCDEKDLKTGNQNYDNFVGMRLKRLDPKLLYEIYQECFKNDEEILSPIKKVIKETAQKIEVQDLVPRSIVGVTFSDSVIRRDNARNVASMEEV